MSGMMYPGSVDYVRRCGEKEHKNTNKTGQLGQKGILISVFAISVLHTPLSLPLPHSSIFNLQ